MDLLRKRLYSFTFDILIIFILNKGLMGLYFKTLEQHYPLNQRLYDQALEIYPFIQFSLFTCLFFGYFIWAQYVWDGKTIGTHLNKIKVVNSNKKIPALGQISLRTLGTFICYISGLILFIPIAFTKDNKGLADWMSSTYIIRDDTTGSLQLHTNESFEYFEDAA
jgi:uncharacterized RDD family membrane protein YckC